MKTVKMTREYMSIPKGMTTELADRLADQLVKDGFAEEVAEATTKTKAKRLPQTGIENKSMAGRGAPA